MGWAVSERVVLLCLLLSTGTTSCAVGRTLRGLGHLCDHRHAQATLDALDFPATEIHRESTFHRCREHRVKYLDQVSCLSRVGVYYGTTRSSGEIRSRIPAPPPPAAW